MVVHHIQLIIPILFLFMVNLVALLVLPVVMERLQVGVVEQGVVVL
jgi:hypothetical protein